MNTKMKKLFLLFALMSIAFTAMAQAGLDPNSEETVHYVFHRSSYSGAVNPVTHTTYVPQSGIFEMTSEYWLEPGDGDPYEIAIKNIVYGSEIELGDYYVYGIFYSGQIIVPIPQVIQTGAKGGRRAVLTWGNLSYDATTGASTFVVDNSHEYILYDMENDRIVIEGSSGPVVVEGPDNVSFDATGPAIIWMDEDDDENYEWAGYCEWATDLRIVMDEQPEGELKTYKRTSDCIHHSDSKSTYPTAYPERMEDQAEIVFSNDGKNVYFKDPLQSMNYNSWIMGTLNEDKTSIKVVLPQYLNFGNAFGFGIPLMKGESQILEDDGFEILSKGCYHEITYAIDGNTIKLENTWADFSAPYPDNFKASGICAYDPHEGVGSIEANIIYTLESDTPQPTEATANPVINGYPIDNGNAYRVEIVPAEPSTVYYRLLAADGSSTSWQAYNSPLVYNVPGIWTVEAYAVANGKLPSEHVYYEFEIRSYTGVSETAAAKQIVSSRYFNVMGQEIQQPDGLTIIVTTYSDGTATVAKVMK